jgi:hypothetical protein
VAASPPSRMPDSNLLTLFFTEREDRFIACDGGRIWELIRETKGIANKDVLVELRDLAEEYGLKEGEHDGEPIFFKECHDRKLISSIAFDLANFATMAAHVLLATFPEEEEEKETRFVTNARAYLEEIIDPRQKLYTNRPIPGVPHVKWSAIISTDSRLWIIPCINGATLTDFRKNTSDAALNLKEAFASNARPYIQRAIPLLNNTAAGYDPEKLHGRIEELAAEAKTPPVLWTNKDELRSLIAVPK